MTPVEIIALIFIILSIIKLVVIFINPNTWYSTKNPLARLVWGNLSATIFSFLLGGVVLFYLLHEINIVQVFVAIVFTFLLAILTVAPNIEKIMKATGNQLKKENFFAKHWVAVFVWVSIMAWVAYEIFVNMFS